MDFEVIKKLAKSKGTNVKELMNEIGMSEANFYKCVKRNSMESKYIEALSKALNVPVSYFFNEKPIESNSATASRIEKLEKANRKKDFIIDTFRMFFYNQNPELAKQVEKSMNELKDDDF